MKSFVEADVPSEAVGLLCSRAAAEQQDDDHKTLCEVTHFS